MPETRTMRYPLCVGFGTVTVQIYLFTTATVTAYCELRPRENCDGKGVVELPPPPRKEAPDAP